MRAFIVRPFGQKQGIDFDRVEAELIDPVLTRLGIAGRTTGEVIEAGNIREDMFKLLLVSDLVIADISIENANVSYELGIRHALRQRRTFLIRARGTTTEVPFDLRTDRYLAYDPAQPSACVEALFDGLEATLASERQDSPVFRLLPDLREQPRSTLLPVPRGFREEVEDAANHRLRGKLALLGSEAAGAVWECEGFRLVGREQFAARAFEAAAVTFEAIRDIDADDVEANLRLGTIYQRLGDPSKSDLALRRVIARTDAAPADRAEALALLGRNLKSQWREAWDGAAAADRQVRALESPLLLQAQDAYARGFREDLNHFFSGLNALALLTVALELAKAKPDCWTDQFDDEATANWRRDELEAQRRLLAGAVELGVNAAYDRMQREEQNDPWVQVSRADVCLLTGRGAGVVSRAYREALENQDEFIMDSVRSQLRLYADLGILGEAVTRVLGELTRDGDQLADGGQPRTLLFTGHQIDAPGRAEPRFPADKEPQARAAIREAVQRELATTPRAIGLAGGASGGDILFHEVCAELGVPTLMYLALPPDDYVTESVAPAGADWVRRFRALQARFPNAPVLASSRELPGWLMHKPGYTIWQRNNLWMLNEALSAGASHLTVLALWNGKAGDGPGGTADMIETARARGADVRVLDTNAIF